MAGKRVDCHINIIGHIIEYLHPVHLRPTSNPPPPPPLPPTSHFHPTQSNPFTVPTTTTSHLNNNATRINKLVLFKPAVLANTLAITQTPTLSLDSDKKKLSHLTKSRSCHEFPFWDAIFVRRSDQNLLVKNRNTPKTKVVGLML